jgi:hypothetical protein
MDHYRQDRQERVPVGPNELDRVIKVALAAILMLALTYLLR